MLSSIKSLYRPHTATFDCWSTLIYQGSPTHGPESRAHQLAQLLEASVPSTVTALRAAWTEHQLAWHRREVFDARAMIDHTLRALGLDATEERVEAIIDDLTPALLSQDIRTLPGARAALETLSRAGVRLALICDTGFSGGKVVRQLLDRHGLLAYLEVTIFSDEVGVPKPHPRMFQTALDSLGVSATGAVHVGDLRRSDIAGARAVGMGTIRLTAHNNDDSTVQSRAGVIDCRAAGCAPPCERPEADYVAGSLAAVLRAIGHG